METQLDRVLAELKAHADPNAAENLARFGVSVSNAWGVTVPVLRRLGKEVGPDHNLAGQLWRTGVYDARLLATLVDDPTKVTPRQMERWAKDINSWALCDAACGCLFDKTPYAWDKATEWTGREEEYVKRAGFVLMATLAVHDKKAPDERFEELLPYLIRHAADERHFVKKGINWALRQIGKRNRRLNGCAVATARGIHKLDSRAARWIASDALRELTSEKVRDRLKA